MLLIPISEIPHTRGLSLLVKEKWREGFFGGGSGGRGVVLGEVGGGLGDVGGLKGGSWEGGWKGWGVFGG